MAYTFRWVPTTGQNNSFVQNNNTGKGYAVVQTQQNPFNSPLYICIPPTTFQGGDAGAASLYDFAKLLATTGPTFTIANPAINYNGKRLGGGKLTINGNPCGNYEYNILPTTSLTQSSVSFLFSSTNDISSWIVCKGNLTLEVGTVLIPNILGDTYTKNPPTGTAPDGNVYRRLFMVVYVTGTLTFSSGSLISMSACGGNSDTTGANIASFQIPVANGLSNGSPSIAAAGTTPTAPTPSTSSGITGPPGEKTLDVYSTGGGGSGYMSGTTGGSIPPGTGGAGSCFSGGTGGGNNNRGGTGATNGSSLGGTGGNTNGAIAAGGTGNPGGTGSTVGTSGTGGILIIIAGSINGSVGSVAANGVGVGTTISGGASGGGIIIQISGDGTYVGSGDTYVFGGAGIANSAAGGTGTAGNYTI